MQRAGKEFEELTTRMERVLAPLGAVVKTPDYIVDQITGHRREVDASIRFPDQPDRLITVECRDYKEGRQDDRWIEQLVTKKEKIGADKTIAVSSTGFSDSAIKTAQHYGIELREMAQISDAEIAQEWIRGFGISVIYPEFVLDDVSIVDDRGEPVRLDDLPNDISEEFKRDPTSTPFLKIRGVSELVSAANIFDAKVDHNIWRSREDEEGFPITITMKSKGDGYRIPTPDGDRIISQFALKYVVWKKETKSSIESVRRYSSMEETLLDQIEAVADLGDYTLNTNFFGRLHKPFPTE